MTGITCILCVVLSVGYWLGGTRDNTWGALPAESIWSGGYGGLISTTFLHARLDQNPFHLLFNLLWLGRIGALVERTLGHLEWAVFFLGAAFVASGAELAFFSNDAIGMSGVVYALFGLVWGARRAVPVFGLIATDENVRFFLGWMVLCFVLTLMGMWNIANAAHAGGLLFGLAIAGLFFGKEAPAWKRLAAGAILLVLIGLAVLSVTYLPWSLRWQTWQQALP